MDIHQLLVLGHIIGTALGVGGATVSDAVFFRSIKDNTVSRDELSIFTILSRIVMTGFLLLVASGLGFLILAYINYGSLSGMPDRLIAKIIVTFIIGGNSFVLSHKVMPLIRKNLGKKILPILQKHSFLILTSGTISIISWYTTLFLGAWRKLPASYEVILLVYVLMLVSGIAVANSVGIRLLKKYISK